MDRQGTEWARRLAAVVVLAVAVAACGSGDAPGEGPDDEEVASSPSPTAAPDEPSPTPSPAASPDEATPPPRLTLALAGEEEVVFDWSADACEPEHVPDLATRAFRDADGQVQLIISHYVNYRMVGPELDALTPDCSRPVLRSDYDEDPAAFDDSEWLASTWTEDGSTVYGLVHNEYRGHTHAGRCPSGDYFTCLDTSITAVVSTDGGDSYQEVTDAPDHLVATLPLVHDPEGVPSGTRAPSNIIRGQDGFFYVFSNVSASPTQEQWVCLMRTDDLTAPDSWRFWTGEDFSGEFVDPYRTDVEQPGDSTCGKLASDDIGAQLNESITYHEPSGRYVLVGISADQIDGREVWGYYYSTSTDLLEWTRRRLLVEVPLPWTVDDGGRDLSTLYPTLLDPDSTSRNFDTVGDTAYLYYSRINRGQSSLDRDLVRVPVELTLAP